MPIPATTGQFRTRLEDMQIGDYIAYKAIGATGVPCTISDIGAPLATAQANEIPLTGSVAPNGYAYAIKTDKGIAISDRVIQHSISWDALNTAKMIQGTSIYESIFKTRPSSLNFEGGSILWDNTGYLYRQQINAFDGSEDSYTQLGGANQSVTIEFNIPRNDLKLVKLNMKYIKDFTLSYTLDKITWVPFKTLVGDVETTIVSKFNIPIGLHINAIKLDTVSVGNTPYFYEFDIITNMIYTRSLTGGNAYLGTDGKMSLTDKGLGAWPINNEWDKYIINSNLSGKITASDDNVWHSGIGALQTYTQDTPINGLVAGSGTNVQASSISRIWRSMHNSGTSGLWFPVTAVNGVPVNSASGYEQVGFRPVFEYLEPNSKATTLWY